MIRELDAAPTPRSPRAARRDRCRRRSRRRRTASRTGSTSQPERARSCGSGSPRRTAARRARVRAVQLDEQPGRHRLGRGPASPSGCAAAASARSSSTGPRRTLLALGAAQDRRRARSRAPPGERFARARGFVPTRREHVLRLELADADLAGARRRSRTRGRRGLARRAAPRGRRTSTGCTRVYAARSRDVPADDPRTTPPEEFERAHPRRPGARSATRARSSLDGDRPVSLAFLLVNPERCSASSDMTGTLPEYRGRGPRAAREARASCARRSELGFTELMTENDADERADAGG